MSKKRVYKAEVFSKINLSLEITGKAGNLHTLKMLVCPYKEYKDIVTFYPSDVNEADIYIEVAETYSDKSSSQSNKVAEVRFDKVRFTDFFAPKVNAIAKKLGVSGKLEIIKGVPLGAGLGGSTASIVGALKAMSEYAQDIQKSAALDDGFLISLGSDVPCMLYGKPCVVSGVGEIVKPVRLPFDTECFKVEIASGGSDTRACYRKYDELVAEGADTSRDLNGINCASEIIIDGERFELYRNDLTMPACLLNENIQKLINALRKKSDCVFLSGSGSAVVYKNHKL